MLYFVFIVYPLEIFISLVDCAVIQLMAQPLYHPKGFQYIKTYFGTIFMWKSSQISGFCSHVLRLFPYHVVCNMNMYRDDSFLPFGNSHFLDILSCFTAIISPMKGFLAILSRLQYISSTKSTKIRIFYYFLGDSFRNTPCDDVIMTYHYVDYKINMYRTTALPLWKYSFPECVGLSCSHHISYKKGL